MKVKVVLPEHATSSYAGRRVRNGEIIDIEPGHFSERWMVKLQGRKNGASKLRRSKAVDREVFASD